jgi:hypothetical protein
MSRTVTVILICHRHKHIDVTGSGMHYNYDYNKSKNSNVSTRVEWSERCYMEFWHAERGSCAASKAAHKYSRYISQGQEVN